LLQGDDSLSAEQQELIQTIQRNVMLEARLIDDLLDLTSIARNKLALHITTADVHELINQVVKMCAADFAAKDLTLETRLEARRHTMQADPTRLQQVIWNLVKNAIKFTNIGGRISISTTDAAPGHVAIEVADDGIGIAQDVLPHIFDEFEQGGKEVTRLFGGLGLGLAISKALVELQGGVIVATSEGHGRGSKFTVRLPTSSGNRPATPQKSSKATPRLECSILLVEDHADTRRSMTALLGRIGCDVKAAGTVVEALELATSQPFDVLISDIGLPDGSGVELMRELRAKFGLRGIALSGYGMEEDLAKSSDAGFEAHLTKPVHFQILVETVRRLVTAPAKR
jgi:CheY-like chemotaxis protein